MHRNFDLYPGRSFGQKYSAALRRSQLIERFRLGSPTSMPTINHRDFLTDISDRALHDYICKRLKGRKAP